MIVPGQLILVEYARRRAQRIRFIISVVGEFAAYVDLVGDGTVRFDYVLHSWLNSAHSMDTIRYTRLA